MVNSPLVKYQRILIIGCCGSGKSTYARQLKKQLNLPLIHLDNLYWKPNWTKPHKEEWLIKLEETCKKETWIIEGDFLSSLPLRSQYSDAIILIDRPRYLCIYRVLKRLVQYSGKTRDDLPEGCPEKFDFQFLKYVWNYRKDRRPLMLKHFKKLNAENFPIFRLSKSGHIERLQRDSN